MVKFNGHKISFRESPSIIIIIIITLFQSQSDQEEIVVTNNDSDSDVDYIPGGSGTDELNDLCPSDSSILSKEQNDLLIGVVEVKGRENCDSGSFLDYQTELPWKKQIQNFIGQQEVKVIVSRLKRTQ